MTDRASRASCPPDETLAAFIDGTLPVAIRKRITRHVTECADCYDVWMTAWEVRAAGMPPTQVPRRWPVTLRVALSVAIVGALLWVAPLIRERFDAKPASSIGKLAAALPAQRLIDGRIDGFPYRPLREKQRGSAIAPSDTEQWKVYSVAAEAASAAKAAPTPRTLHALGVSHLVLGNWNDAVLALEKAVVQETRQDHITRAIRASDNVPLLNDLSVAYYARGTNSKNGQQDFVAAVEAAEAAFARRKTPTVAFNRALAIEAATGGREVTGPWNDYLQIEPASPWADEVRARLKRHQPAAATTTSNDAIERCYALACGDIRGALAHQYLHATAFTWETVLDDWARAVRVGDAGSAARSLAFADGIGSIIEAETGDATIADSVRRIRNAHLDDAVAAHASYAQARRLYRSQAIRAARSAFAHARESAARANLPIEIYAAAYLAATMVYSNEFSAAAAVISVTQRKFQADHYSGALGQLRWTEGVLAMRRGHPQQALLAFRETLRRFEQAHQTENVASAHALLAEASEMTGDRAAAWSHRFRAMQSLDDLAQPDRVFIVLGELADAAHDQGWLHAAACYRRLVRNAVEPLQNPGMLLEASAAEARGHIELGQMGRASANLAVARRCATAIPEADRRQRYAALLALTEADFAAVRHSAMEDALLTAAADAYRKRDDHFASVAVLTRRAQHRLRMDRIADAEQDALGGIGHLETLRSQLDGIAARSRYFATSQPLFDVAIACAWNQQRYADAFTLAEQSRGRWMRDRGSIAPVSLAETMAVLPSDARIVEYALIPGSLLIWVISHDRFVPHAVPVIDAAIPRLLAATRNAESDAAFLQASTRLYNMLIAPIAQDIANAARITFVPNKYLADVPFPALYDPQRRQHIIERAEVVVTPSATLYVVGQRRDTALAQSVSVLLAGHAGGEGHDTLSGVNDEINDIARLYRNPSRLLSSTDPNDFLTKAGSAGIVHFAGHALSSNTYPEFASLVIGPAAPLYAHEIAAAHFERTRVVVLSSCGTHSGTSTNEGSLGLPYAFLAAGVPAVVAATAAVTDGTASGVATKFHALLARSHRPAAAFRAAQQDMIRHGVSARRWGVWQFLGGPSS